MKIIEYSDKYEEDVKDLLVQLQEHLVEVDYNHFQVMKERYRENCFKRDMKEVLDNEGKIYLAKEDDKIIGLVIGTIPPRDEEDMDTNTCARNGKVLELVVSKNSRKKGTGKALLNKIEEYFKNNNCENVMIDVYAPNERALEFYTRQNYSPIEYTVMKKIKT